MRSHRNPVRPKVPKQPTANNPPRRRRGPTLRSQRAAALRTVLGLLASVDRRRAMRFIEAVSALVALSPTVRR